MPKQSSSDDILFQLCPPLRRAQPLARCLSVWAGAPCASLRACLATRIWTVAHGQDDGAPPKTSAES